MENCKNDVLEIAKKIDDRFCEIETMLGYEEVITDQNLTKKLCKEKKSLQSVHNLYDDYKTMLELGYQDECKKILAQISKELVKVKNERNNFVVEISAKKCDDNSYLQFLENSYQNFCKKMGFDVDISSGKNSAKLSISGFDAKKYFENEVGVHRFVENGKQQELFVFVYDTQNMPNLNLAEKDVRVDVFRSNGAGGQNVNKVSTAIRVTHLKTNIVATCQDERSQFQNRERAFEILKNKLANFYETQSQKQVDAQKKEQLNHQKNFVARTYNFDKNVVKDSRTDLCLPLEQFKNGEIEQLFNILILKKEKWWKTVCKDLMFSQTKRFLQVKAKFIKLKILLDKPNTCKGLTFSCQKLLKAFWKM